MHYYDPLSLNIDIWGDNDILNIITESTFNINELILEESSNIKKKNLIQKIWGIIKKAIKIIGAKFRELTHAFVSIFKTKKVNDKTLDQIAEYVLGISDKEPGNKHLKFRFDDDKRITINYIANTIKNFVNEPEIKGHAKNDRPEQNAIMLIFHIIKRPDLLDPVIEMLESIKNNNGQVLFDINRMNKAIDAIWAGLTLGLGCTITLEQWTVLNEKIIRLNKLMEVVDEDTFMATDIHIQNTDGTSVNSSSDTKLAKMLNELVNITILLQLGINYVGDGMRQVYELDKKFHNKINISNFQEKLPLFVKMCVESNIPSKYIYHANHQICDISINSNPKDSTRKDENPSPLKGNGRYVMFPSDKSLAGKIIKVAYNGLGSRGNKNEFEVWNRVKNIPEISKELYHIYDIGDKDYYVILTDRAIPIDDYNKTSEWNEKMKSMCINNNLGFVIRCNSGGFGKIGDKIVCIDYGNVNRI